MKFGKLAEYFGKVEDTTLRNSKTAILAELFKELTSDEVAKVAYLSVGRLGPLYDPLEFGLAGKMVIRAVAWGTGDTAEHVMQLYKDKGDIGEVVENIKSLKINTIREFEIINVFAELYLIAQDKGKGSQERKVEKLGKLLKEMDAVSCKYVVRLVMGKLRLGFSDLTILDALSWAQTGGKNDRDELERAFNVWSDMGEVARVYKQGGLNGLAKLDVVPGRPVKPMRAERLGTVAEIVAKLERFAVEPKYDGMRVQLHVWENRLNEKKLGIATDAQVSFFATEEEKVLVKIFSRGLEDITAMFPDVVKAAMGLHKISGDCVLDGEALGIDLTTNTFLPFQETMKRKRKHDVGEMASMIPLSVQVFDVLYVDGHGRLSETYEERRKWLLKIIKVKKYSEVTERNIFCLAESTIVESDEEAQELFDKYMEARLEGMLCKKLDSKYRAGARDFNWVKYKRAHEEGLVDTIDCVVMGYYVGKGKRQKFGVGAFLVGVLSEDKIVTVAKIGTGLSDDQFRELFERMKSIATPKMPNEYVVPKALIPDFWVTPSVVVEIQSDEITKSPIHSAEYALRFPRLVKFRDDKKLGDITTVPEVKAMFGI